MSAKTIIVTRPSGQARQLIEVLTRTIEFSGVAKRSFPEILSLPLLTIGALVCAQETTNSKTTNNGAKVIFDILTVGKFCILNLNLYFITL